MNKKMFKVRQLQYVQVFFSILQPLKSSRYEIKLLSYLLEIIFTFSIYAQSMSVTN